MDHNQLISLLGDQQQSLLSYQCEAIPKSQLNLPGRDFIERVLLNSSRSTKTICSLTTLFNSGRLSGTGYLSILPVDQGIEHSAGASFCPNPIYFDPENIIRLALEAGCNAVVSSTAILSALSRRYAHHIPFIAKLNHNELLSFPNKYDQVIFSSVRNAWNAGACGIGATVYFGSAESSRQIEVIASAFEHAHELGMFTILWCYLRNDHFIQNGKNYHTAADLTGQANYLGANMHADVIKQKLPDINGGYPALNPQGQNYGKFDQRMYSSLTSPHPIDLCRYQVMNCFAGRVGLINSGGPSLGSSDLSAAVKTAVINKRAGGTGIIAGRTAFQRPYREGIELLNAIQQVYMDEQIQIA